MNTARSFRLTLLGSSLSRMLSLYRLKLPGSYFSYLNGYTRRGGVFLINHAHVLSSSDWETIQIKQKGIVLIVIMYLVFKRNG